MADLDGQPVLAHVLAAIRNAGVNALCVVADGKGAAALFCEANGVPTVESRDHALGMAHSLRAGLSACPREWDAVIVALGDMPLITSGLISAIAATSGPNHIVMPVVGAERGNPVSWGRAFFEPLSTLSGDQGGRILLPHFADAIREVQWHDLSEIRLDVDDPDTLEIARQTIHRRARHRSEQ